jgi:2-iminobutanoate/2-iminopropanoate deaminase
MPRDIVFTSKAAKPSPTYSQAVKAAGLVFVSGTAPTDPATGQIKGTTIQEQTRQCLANVAAILEAAGTSLDKIVSATVILADEDEFAGMNEEWIRWFPTDPPARQGAKLPVRIPGLKVPVASSLRLRRPASTARSYPRASFRKPDFAGVRQRNVLKGHPTATDRHYVFNPRALNQSTAAPSNAPK